MESIVDELLEVKVLVDSKIIIETLTRCGIINKSKKEIYPSCYLHEIDGKTYLTHFKELFILTRKDGYNNISKSDIIRRNSIAYCLKNWGMIEVVDENIEPHNEFISVLPYGEKKDWFISHKFNFKLIGGK